ncbi:MAG: aminotransferase class V-fold PLP-dependent enzyme [Weeksellaceae bacterium]
MLDIKQIKKDFPIFTHLPELVYLDSTATSLKPQVVIDAVNSYYSSYSANVHRGIYQIAEKATQAYEDARDTVKIFINATRREEVIFTRGTTESMNLLASSLSELISEGDEIVTTIMEHHSNFVPWQQLAKKKKATFKVIDIDDNYQLRITNDEYLKQYITSKTKILALTYVSNTLGTMNPIKQIVKAAKQINPNIIVILDAAQAAPHLILDVQELGCDFVAFSGHKMLGPTGIGVLWGTFDQLDKLPPYQYGGEMIRTVAVENTTWNDLPHRLEAGTPPIAQAIGLAAAIRYLQSIGLEKIHQHEAKLTKYAIDKLYEKFGDEIKIFGPIGERAGIISFTLGNYHAHDVAQILDESHIAVRAGHHCTMPLHTRLGIAASARASFYIYNDESDVEKLVAGLQQVKTILK